MRHNLLVVDDEESVRESIQLLLEDDYQIFLAKNGFEALEVFKKEKIDLVLLDIRMPGMSGLEVLAELENLDPIVQVIMVTATHEVDVAVESIRRGARHYLTKPFSSDDLMGLIKKLLRNRTRRLGQLQSMENLDISALLNLSSMASLRAQIEESVRSPKPVSLEGDNGTEQEGLAYYLHQRSGRMHYLEIHCGQIEGITGQLADLEEMLFGGRLIDAVSEEISHLLPDTTLCLNRIDLLTANHQEELLHYFQRLIILQPDFFQKVRLISTTVIALETLVSQGHFEEELFHYVNGIRVVLWPLHQRQQDLKEIVSYYFQYFNRQWGTEVSFSPEVAELLVIYPWPGNLTELKNTVNSLILRKHKGKLELEDLPFDLLKSLVQHPQLKNELSSDRFLHHFERRCLSR
jgi:DNA-binding NtrC family response regulator